MECATYPTIEFVISLKCGDEPVVAQPDDDDDDDSEDEEEPPLAFDVDLSVTWPVGCLE